MKQLITILLLGFQLAGFSQQTYRIPLNPKVEDDKLKKTQAIIPVYKYTGLDIEPYSNFGTVEIPKSKWLKIKKLPDLSDCKDTGFTFIYFSGADNPQNSGYLLAIIGNYTRARYTTHFFLDKNNNLDFTDDGPEYVLPYQKDSMIINLSNINEPKSDYELKLSRIVLGKNLAYKDLLNDHYTKRSGSKVFTKINNCFREQRYNWCSADFRSETDSFTIAVKDMNVNALYNDNGSDAVYIGPYHQPIISEDLYEFSSGKKKTVFEWNEKQFTIVNIDKLGGWIEISSADPNSGIKKLKVGRRVPKISFMNEMNVKYSLKQFKKKHVYLYFWNDDLSSLAADTMYLRKLQLEYGNKIQVIGLNYGDEPKSMRFFQQYYRIPWIIGMSTKAINKKYYVENLPKCYWIGKRRKLKGRNITPKQMYEKAVEIFPKPTN